MAMISIENLQPGMVVASDVQNRVGKLMLPAGTEIQEKHLRILKAWGVTEVEVKGHDDVEHGNIDQATLEKAEAQMKAHFKFCDLEQPMIVELFKHCVARKAAQLEGEKNSG